MKIKLRNRRGAVSVWLTISILVLTMSFIVLYTFLNHQHEQNEMIRRLELSSRWLLSHYDMTLFQRYGLLGYNQEYLKGVQIFADNLEGSETILKKENTLNEGEVFTKQAIRCVQLDLVKGGIKNLSESKVDSGSRMSDLDQALKENQNRMNEDGDRSLKIDSGVESEGEKNRAQSIKNRLDQLTKEQEQVKISTSNAEPSDGQLRISESYMSKLRNREIGTIKPMNVLEVQLFNEYILGRFHSGVSDAHLLTRPSDGSRFLKNTEIQFILQGHASAAMNESLTKAELIAIRTAVNGLHLLTCHSHRSGIAAMALSMTSIFPVAEPVVFSAIVLGWSYLESLDEWHALQKGDAIANLKMTDLDWRTDFFLGSKGESVASIPIANRLYFSDCLRLMLNLRTHQDKLKRVMTLIELNMGDSRDVPYDLGQLITCHTVTTKWRQKDFHFKDGYSMDRDGRYLDGAGNEE